MEKSERASENEWSAKTVKYKEMKDKLKMKSKRSVDNDNASEC